MDGVILEVRKRSRGNVTAPMVLWSLAMAIVIFLLEARVGSATDAVWVGVAVSVMLGTYLGWRRRSAAVLVAPMVSWLFAWPLLWIAAMIHHGFFSGFFEGLFLITIGWLAIGAVELGVLAFVAFSVRALRGASRSQPDVVVFSPRGE